MQDNELDELIARTKDTMLACRYLAEENRDGGDLLGMVGARCEVINGVMDAYQSTRDKRLLGAVYTLLGVLGFTLNFQLSNDRDVNILFKNTVNWWFDLYVTEMKGDD